jgi:hypothetical protein
MKLYFKNGIRRIMANYKYQLTYSKDVMGIFVLINKRIQEGNVK